MPLMGFEAVLKGYFSWGSNGIERLQTLETLRNLRNWGSKGISCDFNGISWSFHGKSWNIYAGDHVVICDIAAGNHRF